MKMFLLTLLSICLVVSGAPEGNPVYTNPSPVYKIPDSNLFVADQPNFTPESSPVSPTAAAVVQHSPVQPNAIQGTTLVAPVVDGTHLYNPEGYVDPYNSMGYAVQPGYEPGYGVQTGYEGYLVPSSSGYYPVATTDSYSPISYLYSLLPQSSTVLSVITKGATVIAGGIVIVLVGAAAVFGFCAYTPYCHIKLNGFNTATLKEEVRAYMTPEKISAAARFVREAIDKYQKLQPVEEKTH